MAGDGRNAAPGRGGTRAGRGLLERPGKPNTAEFVRRTIRDVLWWMNEPSQGMSNVYSGFPQHGPMRAEPSAPPPSGEGPVGALGSGWEKLGLLCHLCGLSQVSHKGSRSRILEWFGLGGILKIIQLHPLAVDRTSDRWHFSWCVEDPLSCSNPLSGFT